MQPEVEESQHRRNSTATTVSARRHFERSPRSEKSLFSLCAAGMWMALLWRTSGGNQNGHLDRWPICSTALCQEEVLFGGVLNPAPKE